MVKNWLIRTKNNHILGPVSKTKIRELIGNGSIKGDDEICSGNGYWIYVREQDLVAKYILSNEKQSFNPVQEAEPVLALSPAAEDLEYPSPEGEDLLPPDNDLEYPDMESQAEITQIGVSLSDITGEDPASDELGEDDLDHFSEEADHSSEGKKKSKVVPEKTPSATEPIPVPKLKNRKKPKAPVPKPVIQKSLLGGRALMVLLFLVLFVLILILLNRKGFIKQVINYTSALSPISTVVAQDEINKKKSGFPLLN